MTKNAFVTIIGRANSGKSSFMNSVIGEKIAVVSDKPQTTRTKITGVLTEGDTQYVFMDTPGIHKTRTKLGTHMMQAVKDSVTDIDVILMMSDISKKIGEDEMSIITSLQAQKVPVILLLNKIDLVSKEQILESITEYSKLYNFDSIIPVSVLNGDGIDEVMAEIQKKATEGPHYFPDDMLTDQPERVIAAEIIREKMLILLNDEVPHGIAVTIEKMKERKTSDKQYILDVEANIFCERDSHKGIIIGKGGAMLKKIGSAARTDLESFFEIKVNLQCWVKVKKDWRNKEGMIKNFGLDS